jgi:glucose/arabinose dehydrogenase
MIRHRLAAWRQLVVFLFLVISLAKAKQISATILPDGFAEIQYATGLTDPTAMAFAPDPCPTSGTPVHRLFVCEKEGTVRVFRNGVLQPNPFLTVNADTRGERGLDGICFDPNFATNGNVYVYYTISQADLSLPTHNRLSRFTADPSHPDVAVAGSETPIMEMDDLRYNSYIHNGGALHFGPDGKLYISTGENGNASNAQALDTILGKILRINPVPENADGTNPESTFPADNPFYNSTTGKNRAIYIRGLRNPFTFNFQPGTGRMFIDDVGSAFWEEINEGIAGANYGWPIVEGPSSPPGYDLDNSDPRVPGFLYPLLAYSHYPLMRPYGCAITGGAFYNPAPRCAGDPPFGFPSSYLGKYFYLDFCQHWIYVMDPDQIDPASPFGFHTITLFASGLHNFATYLVVGPSASLYYISREDGAVYQIHYPASLAPTIGTQPANQLVGQGWPATFSISASGVPPLHYQWQRGLNGGMVNIPGAPDSTTYTLANPQVVGDNQAVFRCVVSNSYGTTASQAARLTVLTKQPPNPVISSPLETARYVAGQTITFSGSAVDGHDIITGDPQDGVLGPDAFTWQILFEHHPLSDPEHHTHPFFPATTGIAGGTIALNFGETDPDVWYRIFFTARDSYGLQRTIFRDIFPAKSHLSVQTSPVLFPGTNVPLKVKIDSLGKRSPYSFWSVVNMQRNIGVDSPQVLNGLTYDFYSWSDGGPRSHNIATPAAATTYVANFWKRPGYGSITANPNPVQVPPGNTTGITNIYWSSGQTVAVEVHRDSPSGPLFARTAAGSFSLPTGNWVTEGTRLFLQDVSGGQPLTPEFTLDSMTLHVTTAPRGSITANPNPFVPDSHGLGQTTLAWTSYGTTSVEIHVGAPNGPGFVSGGPGSFSATTPRWIQDGQTFFLQNVSNGLPLTPANTLATVTMRALRPTPRGSITALPNPFTADAQGLGETILTWTSTGTSNVEVHLDRPDGNLLTSSGPGNFSAHTGHWVQNGQIFYLQNVSGGLPLTSANTLATVTATAAVPPAGSISANPNPFPPDPQGLGQTTLTWTSSQTTRVEVHVNRPDGNFFTSSGPGTFSATTGQWVHDGQTFYLQNVSNGLPLTPANTLATVTVTAAP